MKKVSVFGSTGVVGQKAVQVLLDNPRDFAVEVLTAKSSVHLLALQARLANAKMVVVRDASFYRDLRDLLSGTGIKVEAGEEGLAAAASLKVNSAIMAIVGISALEPVMQLIKTGIGSIALASKESIVCGGSILVDAAARNKVSILPIDSEHNAIFQILCDQDYVDKVTLTASGGPFLFWSDDAMKSIVRRDALRHPIWKMGRKISVDSATMVNKSLEMIEAHYLFSLDPGKIDVIVHPESVVHAMVSYVDGACVAFMSVPDMSLPLRCALYWPERRACDSKLSLSSWGKLTFIKPDEARFPALRLGFEVLGSPNCHAMGVVFNAANEVAVSAFLNFGMAFLDIVNVIYAVLERVGCREITSLSSVFDLDSLSREIARDIVAELTDGVC